VLLVGEERCAARLFYSWVAEQFPTRAVSTTERALDEVATTAVDVVVVDDLWLRDSSSDLLRQPRGADEPCRTLFLFASASRRVYADHSIQLPAGGETVRNAIGTARQTGEHEQMIERLIPLVDQWRVFEQSEGCARAECRQAQQRTESLHAHIDDNAWRCRAPLRRTHWLPTTLATGGGDEMMDCSQGPGDGSWTTGSGSVTTGHDGPTWQVRAPATVLPP
jgi:hypothetical protein